MNKAVGDKMEKDYLLRCAPYNRACAQQALRWAVMGNPRRRRPAEQPLPGHQLLRRVRAGLHAQTDP